MIFIKSIVLSCIGLYLLVTLGFYLGQRRLIYIPPQFALTDCPDLPQHAEIWNYDGEQGIFANSLTPRANPALVVIYHGNASSSCYWDYLNASFWSEAGYDVLIPEYPGYNLDPRKPSKTSFEAMVKKVNKWRHEHVYEHVILIGSSLGSANANYHATLDAVDEVILYAPFDSIKNVARDRGLYFPSFLIFDHYDNLKTLSQQTAPVTIFHGEMDKTILPQRSEALYKNLQKNGVLVNRYALPNIEHNNINSSEHVKSVLTGIAYSQIAQ